MLKNPSQLKPLLIFAIGASLHQRALTLMETRLRTNKETRCELLFEIYAAVAESFCAKRDLANGMAWKESLKTYLDNTAEFDYLLGEYNSVSQDEFEKFLTESHSLMENMAPYKRPDAVIDVPIRAELQRIEDKIEQHKKAAGNGQQPTAEMKTVGADVRHFLQQITLLRDAA